MSYITTPKIYEIHKSTFTNHRKIIAIFICLIWAVLVFTAKASAQNISTESTFDTEQLSEQVRQARILMDVGNDSAALRLLRSAAENSWQILYNVSGINFADTDGAIPATGTVGRAARESADAHYWWGVTALKNRSRDEAITALARAARLIANDPTAILLQMNIQSALANALQNGLPRSAALDVLKNIAHYANDNQWHLKSTLVESDGTKSTFAYTDGILSAPFSMPRAAPLYKNIPEDKLPATLRSGRIIYAYHQSAQAPLANLQVIVRYGDSHYAPLAAELAQTMARIKVKNDTFLQHAAPPVTLWLETVDSTWPAAAPDNTTTDAPWKAAAKIDSAPYDIMLFRIDKSRSQTEWFRELQHEYGHVAWPNFADFAPPLEPNANGLIAETIGMTHYAQHIPQNDKLPDELQKHLQNNAISSLQEFLRTSIKSKLLQTNKLATSNDKAALQYLQGLCVYIERVYGAKVLSDIMAQLRGATATQSYSALHVLNQLPQVLSEQLSATSRNVLYLPAATLDKWENVAAFARKSSVDYAVSQCDFLIYIPQNAQQLFIPWHGAGTIRCKSTFGEVTSAGNQITIHLNNAVGWQTLRLQIGGNVTLDNAEIICRNDIGE